MLFAWVTQLFHSLLHFIMQPQHPNGEMRVFSKARDATNASSLLNSLKENLPFLRHGLGNIIITKVKYCKCHLCKGSPWEHEFLVVTLEELVGAKQTAYLMVDCLVDDTKEYAGGEDKLLADIAMINMDSATDPNSTASLSPAESGPEPESVMTASSPTVQQWYTLNHLQCSGAKVKRITKGDPPDTLDRLIILPDKCAISNELGKCKFDILMMMDLPKDRSIALECFAHLLRTISRNTPQYHYVFTQCYWYAFTIWRVLELETQPRICKTEHAGRQCVYSRYGKKLVLGRGSLVNARRAPEMIRAQWKVERIMEDEEWAEQKKAFREEVHREVAEAEEGRR
ncbi:uncharacterized protein EV420DRAFT_1650268 [Desarmillaria tabescens]|uniref:Uncharacterized protein n=1 Tax=Armillaria tabescens TaxID=1929756 RepID=A0AA39JDR0_ARMTA|nr:uncharacterized protein EV420DRAFT_1650268 [Desarmillaria tabescens]KAK0440902.1 hypothetical protein EV420DRAFT_1650268 [Desarmillaria tabescens]